MVITYIAHALTFTQLWDKGQLPNVLILTTFNNYVYMSVMTTFNNYVYVNDVLYSIVTLQLVTVDIIYTKHAQEMW